MSTTPTPLFLALSALLTTAGNIKSLRSCYPCATFGPWLKTVEAAVEALKDEPLSPTWCASVDAELAATAEADAQPVALETITDAQIEDLRCDANRGYNPHAKCTDCDGVFYPSITLPAAAVAEGLERDGESLEPGESS